MAIFARNKRLNIYLPILSACLLGILPLAACCQDVHAPPRLPLIPETATWAGGVDGGAWMQCSLNTKRKTNWCTVWNDQTGEVWARTHFVLRDTGAPVSESELSFTGFNGIYIGLRDGRWLVPLKFYSNPDRDLWEPTPIEPE